MLTGVSEPASFTSSPRSLSSFTCGRTPFAAAPERRFGSMTTSVDSPVTSSICLATVTPSSTFSNFTRPAYSVMIGREVASHVASTLPAFTGSPSLTSIVAPYGTLWRSRSRPLSSWIMTSPERAMTTISPLALVT